MTSFPVTRVWIDGKQYKDTMFQIELKAGDHQLLLTNPDVEPPINARRTVTVTAGQETKIHYPW